MEEIKPLTEETLDEAVELIINSFDSVHGKGHFEDGWVKMELSAQFSSGPYFPNYYYVFKDGVMVAVAGYAKSLFADNTYELRLAATHPDFMKQGHLTRLLNYRIDEIKEKLKGKDGLIIMDTYRPEIYYKHGFELMKSSEDFNIMMMEIKK